MDSRLSAYALRALPIWAGAWEEDMRRAVALPVSRGNPRPGFVRSRQTFGGFGHVSSLLETTKLTRRRVDPGFPQATGSPEIFGPALGCPALRVRHSSGRGGLSRYDAGVGAKVPSGRGSPVNLDGARVVVAQVNKLLDTDQAAVPGGRRPRAPCAHPT